MKCRVGCVALLALLSLGGATSSFSQEKDMPPPAEETVLDPQLTAEEQKAAGRAEAALRDAQAKKDVAAILDHSDMLRRFGRIELAEKGYASLAGACAGPEELEKLAARLDQDLHPAAGVLYELLIDACIVRSDTASVERVTDRLLTVSGSERAASKGYRFLLEAALRAKDRAKATAASRGLFFAHDMDGAKRGFQGTLALANDASGRLGTFRDFDGFGYSLMTEAELGSSLKDALAQKDDDTATRVLEQMRVRDAAKFADTCMAYFDALKSRKAPMAAYLAPSRAFVFSGDRRSAERLLAVWKGLGDAAVRDVRADDIELAAESVAALFGDRGYAYAAELYEALFSRGLLKDTGKKAYILERLAALGDPGKKVIVREGPPVLKEALSAKDWSLPDALSRLLIDTGDASAVSAGAGGYGAMADMLFADKNYAGAVACARQLLNVKEAGAQSAGKEALRKACSGASAAGVPFDQVIEVADALIQSGDAALIVLARESVRKSAAPAAPGLPELQLDRIEALSRLDDAELRADAKKLLAALIDGQRPLKGKQSSLMIAERLSRSIDEYYRSQGIALLKELWGQSQGGRTLAGSDVKVMIEAMLGSGDPELRAAAERALKDQEPRPADAASKKTPEK